MGEPRGGKPSPTKKPSKTSPDPAILNPRSANLVLCVVVTFAVVFLASSIKNTVQVFFVSMADSFDRSRGQFAIAVSLFMVVQGVASPVIGGVVDRFGSKATIRGGVVAAGVSFLLCAGLPSFGAFVIVYGLLAGLTFTAMSYVPLGVLVDDLFAKHRRGLIYAALTNGTAVGFILLSPLWVALDPYVSWRTVYMVLGLVFLGPLLLLMKSAFPAAGPGAITEPGDGTAVDTPALTAAPLGTRAKLALLLRSRVFFALALGFFGCGVTMAFIDVHMVTHLQENGVSRSVVSLSIALLGITELGGGLFAGYLCDRISKCQVIAGAYLLRAVALVILSMSDSSLGAVVFTSLFGITYLASVIGTTLYALDAYGPGTKGFAIGLIWLFHQLGAFLSTQLGANAFDAFGSYEMVVVVSAIVALGSAVLTWALLPRDPQRPVPAPVPTGSPV